ncbi:MAG TPA: hypothetical protein VK395_19890 [Gemmataceae bacterium]|nr:hypothetical protein [Gemmataceae bacterium]
MRFARWLYLVAGVYGVLIVLPDYFLEEKLGRDYPPPINHPEFFYGFVGTALVWQIVYLMVGIDPRRYRPMMIPTALAKLSFGIACVVLYAQDRLSLSFLLIVTPDLIFGVLFIIAFFKTAPTPRT